MLLCTLSDISIPVLIAAAYLLLQGSLAGWPAAAAILRGSNPVGILCGGQPDIACPRAQKVAPDSIVDHAEAVVLVAERVEKYRRRGK